MTFGGHWTAETYRLDEVTNRFTLPCVVRFSEGFMDATESESISQDDVIKIDKRLNLQKVVAEFVCDSNEVGDTPDFEEPYEKLTEEILIPLNYTGTLKVLHRERICVGVLELKNVFPRYAVVLSNMTVKGDHGGPITIQAGTRIEVDRVIPGNQRVPDNLVISWNQDGSDMVVSVSVANQGRFKTVPDDNEYTLNGVIDRYGFPVVVTFVDDEIRRIYTTDLEEGIDNMKLISATLRLKRLKAQDSIIGHYKPLEDNPDQVADSEYFARRSLVVLPLDNYDIRGIHVHVLQGTDEEIYEDIFLVSNKSHDLNDVLDGTLYVDFQRKPGPRHVVKKKKEEVQTPPPRPPKPATYSGQEKQSTPTRKKKEKHRPRVHNVKPNTGTVSSEPGLDTDDYLKPRSKAPTKAGQITSKPKSKPPDIQYDDDDDDETYEEVSPGPLESPPLLPLPVTALAEMNFEKSGGLVMKESKVTGLEGKWKKFKQKVMPVAGIKATKQYTMTTLTDRYTAWKPSKTDATSPSGKKGTPGVKKAPPAEEKVPSSGETEEKEEEGVFYDYPDTEELMALRMQIRQAANAKPTAAISPLSSPVSAPVKPFLSLTKVELEERLIQCGMTRFAAVCRECDLDGKFFESLTNNVLEKEPFKLSSFDLIKLEKIKQNWVPV